MKIDEFLNLIDTKVAFSTPRGNFEGIVKLILISAERVTFEHVFSLPSRDYLATMHVLISDISSCNVVNSGSRILDVSKFNKEMLNHDLRRNVPVDKSEVIKINSEKHFFDYLPLNLQDKNPADYCIIDSITESFRRVIDELSHSTTVGVSLHGPKISRSGNLSWLCMSTSECVFLFDIEQVGARAFRQGLRRIFEDEAIEKVLHDSRTTADCLLHMFQTNVKNVFDTQVADYLINMQTYTDKEMFKYVCSLDSCLVKYLGVPQQFLYNRNKCASVDEEVKFFQKRPVSEEFMNVLLKSSMYLISLKQVQEYLLLSPFEQAVDLYLNVMRDASDSKVYQEVCNPTHIAPAYLANAIKPIRFCDTSFMTDDIVGKS